MKPRKTAVTADIADLLSLLGNSVLNAPLMRIEDLKGYIETEYSDAIVNGDWEKAETLDAWYNELYGKNLMPEEIARRSEKVPIAKSEERLILNLRKEAGDVPYGVSVWFGGEDLQGVERALFQVIGQYMLPLTAWKSEGDKRIVGVRTGSDERARKIMDDMRAKLEELGVPGGVSCGLVNDELTEQLDMLVFEEVLEEWEQ